MLITDTAVHYMQSNLVCCMFSGRCLEARVPTFLVLCDANDAPAFFNFYFWAFYFHFHFGIFTYSLAFIYFIYYLALLFIFIFIFIFISSDFCGRGFFWGGVHLMWGGVIFWGGMFGPVPNGERWVGRARLQQKIHPNHSCDS